MYRTPIVSLKDKDATAFNAGWLASLFNHPRLERRAKHAGCETEQEVKDWLAGWDKAGRDMREGRMRGVVLDTLLELTELT